MQPYSRYAASAHHAPVPPSPASEFPYLFDEDDEPLPPWTTGDSYNDSLDSTSTGNSTPDSSDASPFHLPTASQPSPASPSPSPSSPSSTSVTAAAPPKRKRQRLAGATKEERMALAVIRHREIDGARRQREKEVVQRLERLTTSDDKKASDDSDETAEGKRNRRNKREKVDVLEESAEIIEQLRAAMKQMEEASRDKDAQITKLRSHMYAVGRAREDFEEMAMMSTRPGPGQLMGGAGQHPLALLPSATADAMTVFDGRQTLMTSTLLASGPCLLLVQQGTGALLEANERFVSLSGYALSDLLFTVLRPPLPGMHVRICPLMLKYSKARGSPIDNQYISQYNSSRQSIIDLCAGKERRVELLWRMYMSDGRLYEVQYTAFVTRQGVMVWLCNLEDAMLVEEWNASVGTNGEAMVSCAGVDLDMLIKRASHEAAGRWRYDGVEGESGEEGSDAAHC